MSRKKKILILGVTGQDGSFMARLMLEKKFLVHKILTDPLPVLKAA